ncbi:MAG: endonuclease YncB(thermonuclease family) [Rickettsiales bacterium]|jgi:endonuclease YncB( thermonuclease family)
MSEIIESENYSQLLKDLKEVIENSKKQAEDVLRNQLNFTYWQVGKRIEEEKIGGDFNYQSMVIKNLSLDLQIDVSTIRRSLQFFKNYPNNPPLKNNLSWSHYKFLLAINDVDLRQELEERAINEGWKAPRLGEEIKNLKNSTPVTESSKINRPSKANYLYKAKILDVVDGDTMVMNVDLGFGVNKEQRIRLAKIDAAEMKTIDGQKAAKYLRDLAMSLEFVIVRTNKIDIYGRYVGDIFYPKVSGSKQSKIEIFENGVYLNEKLVEENFAKIIG